ncbi:MAG: NAD(P)/FAD-dependent oxidoreductase [Hyphomicrobiaceae bacterium]
MFKIAVVGRGLIGSAAARHLTELVDGVVAIGPDEPTNRKTHNGVFGSHYDEGRMTRVVDPLIEWSVTAKRSISRYKDLEQRSGISFFTPAGFLGIGSPGTDYNDKASMTGLAQGAMLSRLSAEDIRAQFPFLTVADDADGLLETGTAGHISPRSMINAQTELAETGGATLIRDAVKTIRPVPGGLEITTLGGALISAERAIVATGAFTKAWGLVPKNVNLRVYGRTIVLARIDETMRASFKGMPTMIVCETDAYILPPIRYPDGHHYLKMGCGSDKDAVLDTSGKLDTWFKGSGSEGDKRKLMSYMTSMFPVLNDCETWRTDTCAVTYTPSVLPTIDFVDEGKIVMAVGGCGKGAKGSDEWGRIAARTVLGLPWEHSFDRKNLMLPTTPS